MWSQKPGKRKLTAQTSFSPAFGKLRILELEETGPLPFPQPPPGGASPLAGGRGEYVRRGVSQRGVTLLMVKASMVLPRSYPLPLTS